MTPRDANPPSGGSRKPNRDRGGWRKGATPPAARSSASSASGSRSWWSARPKEQPQKRSFRTKLVLSLVAMTMLVAAFAWALMNNRDQVPFIAIGVTNYSSELLPPNAWTSEDFQRFKEIANDNPLMRSWWGSEGRSEIEFQDKSPLWAEREGPQVSISKFALRQLARALKDVQPGGPTKSIILYISAHGVVDDKGQPCLLLRDSDPTGSDTWVKVEDLLTTFCEACEKSKAKTKVLALDSGRMETNAACGLLYQDFAWRLEKLVNGLTGQNHEGLVVVNSTSDGQIGWAAPERAGTVFGYFLGQALCGAADGAADGHQSGSVSIGELQQYLERTVADYVGRYRNSKQLPIVLMADASSDSLTRELTYCNARKLSETEQDQERKLLTTAQKQWNDADKWSHLDRLWQEHDKLKKQTPPIYRYEPVGWARFERNLLRLEQLLLAGSAYEENYKSLSKDTWAENHRLAKAANIVAYNLPLNDRRRSPPANPQPSATEAKPAKETPSYPDLAKLVWNQALTSESVTADDLGASLAPLSKGPVDQMPEPIEIHFLRILALYLDSQSTPPELLHKALIARQKAEESASPLDERAQYWIRGAVDAGDARRRLAEDLLFVGPANSKSPDEWIDFEGTEWKQANEQYKDADDLAEIVSQALLLRDRAATELPYLADWAWQSLCRPSNMPRKRSIERVTKVNTSIQYWHELCNGLEDEAAGTIPAMKSLTDQFDKSLRELLSEFEAEGRADGSGHQSDVRDIPRHLSFPLIRASDRTGLRDAFLTKLNKFCNELIRNPGDTPPAKKEKEEEASDKSQAKDTGNAPWDEGSQDAADTATTADIGELLKNTRHPFLEWLGDSQAAPPGGLDFRAQLDEQGGRVRIQLTNAKTNVHGAKQKFHEKLQANAAGASAAPLKSEEVSELRQILSEADLTARKAANWHNQLPDPNESESVTDQVYAIDALQRFDWQQLMLLQARRTLDDFWDRLPAKQGIEVNPYFQAVAEEYLDAATQLGSSEGKNQGQDRLLADCKALLEKRLQGVKQLPQMISPSVTSGEGDSDVDLPLTLSQSESNNLPHGVAAAFVRFPSNFKSVPLTVRNASAAVADNPSLSRLAVALGTKAKLAKAGVAPLTVSNEPHLFRFQLAHDVKALESVVLYRGHVLPHTINVLPPGRQIVYTPDPIVPARVHVSGKETMRTSVMFIFDCSSSMNEFDVPPEKRGDPKGQRFEVARSTLINILEDQTIEQFRVGMRLYGHRIGKNKPEKVAAEGKFVFSPYAKNQQKSGLSMPSHPGEDVELTHPLEQFNKRRRDEMVDTLKQVTPWGITPLYLSIAKAADDTIPPDEQRHIIAITDGVDYQGDVGPISAVTLERLKTRLDKKRSQVAVDIIGFGNEINAEDVSALREEMKNLTTAYGGDFYPAKNAFDLLDSIKTSLQIGRFKVVPEEASKETYRLDLDTWEEPEAKRLAVGSRELKYKVEVVGIKDSVEPMSIALQGGEALDLEIERRDKKPTLMYPSYYYEGHRLQLKDQADLREKLGELGVFVNAPGSDTEYWVAPGRLPEWKNELRIANFFVQVQDLDRSHFTPRPAEAWIEIHPDFGGHEVNPAEIFRFCDLNFLDGQSVPQIVCQARDFPWATANRAHITIWFANSLVTDGVTIVTVDELKNNPRTIDNLTLSAHIGERTGKPTRTLTIEELNPTPPGQVKIHVDARVTHIRHDYSTGKHYFEIPSEMDLKRCAVRLISVDKFKNDATVMKAQLRPQTVGKL